MSPLTTEVAVESAAKEEQQVIAANSWLDQLLAWYKAAVLSPATDKEKAEWQKNSF